MKYTDSETQAPKSEIRNPKSKKVLWLPRWYPNKFDPFDGNFVEAHARIAADVCDLAVLFVHSDPDLKQLYEVKKTRDTQKGFPVIRVYYKKPEMGVPGLSLALQALRFQVAQRMGYAVLKREWGEPDYCHVHVLGRTAWLARSLKKPYFITEHASRYFPENPQFRGRLRKWWTRRVVRDAEEVTVVSEALRAAMESHGLRGNYSILPNIVRTDLFKPGTAPDVPPWHFLHISTLHDVPKNFGGILQAFAKLKARGHDVQLDVLGDGPEKEEQEKLSRFLGLEKAVRFHGNVELEEVAEHFQQTHALVMFSWYETQSIVVLEAFASGRPVVATAVGGLAEHLHPEFSVSVKAGDEEALANGMEAMLARYDDFDKKAMRDYVENLASPDAIRKRFEELYT